MYEYFKTILVIHKVMLSRQITNHFSIRIYTRFLLRLLCRCVQDFSIIIHGGALNKQFQARQVAVVNKHRCLNGWRINE